MATPEDVHALVDGLDGPDIDVAFDMLSRVAASRAERAKRVADSLQLLEEADEITQKVAVECLKYYIDAKPRRRTLQALDSGERLPLPVQRLAQGTFLGAGGPFLNGTYHVLRNTGEFMTRTLFRRSAASLEFPEDKGEQAHDFLLHWVAAREPGSPAAAIVQEYGLRSGRFRLSFRIGSLDGLLFHESVLQDYVERMDNKLDSSVAERSVINPIITLLATDDMERAAKQLSRTQQRKLGM